MRALPLAVLTILLAALPAHAAGVLSVEVMNGYNLVVDSNVTSPSTYAPSAAYIGAKVCNTGDAPLSNVFFHTGNYNGGVGSTPGVFPVHNSTGDLAHPQLTNTGNYSLTLESGNAGIADGQRYIGTLAPTECRVEYWLISYPQCVNVNNATDTPPCAASIAGEVKPSDDLSLDYDVWATTTTAIPAPAVNVRRDFTLRNEISAAANKIWPNTTSKVPDEYLAAIQSLLGWGTLGPDGQPLSNSNPAYPGQRVITTQGIWYDLGNVGQGFDNDGDLVPDQNAWLQPVGDASAFDAGCFRMVNVYGILIVKLKTGGELLIPFQNELYFEHLPDNTGVVGLVYYQYIATRSGCSANMTPYQEAASGFDNEKFSADFGLSNGLASGDFDTDLTFTKTSGGAASVGSTLTYLITAGNTTGVPLGAPDLGVPISIKDAIPAGTTYVTGSADDSPTLNLDEVTGTGSYTQNTTDIDGNLDSCTINYSVTSSQWVVMYSTNNGATWTTTEPGSGVTNIQWLLLTTIALDGYHNNTACVAPDGLYDNGTLQTSLPPGKTVAVRFQVTVAPTAGPVVCNTAGFGFDGGAPALTATDCKPVAGNNTLSGTVFRDNATGGGIYGNGTQDGTETGIGAGVLVSLYYDANGNGEVDSNDLPHSTTNTSATGTFSFPNLADGPYLVVAKKYDGSGPSTANDAVHDSFFGTTGWGNTTTNPQLALTTNLGVLQMTEDATTVTLAVNIDLNESEPAVLSVTNANFAFAPPLRLTKVIAGNPDLNGDGRADTTLDEGDVFNYSITLENRLPSVGTQGPAGCQYVAWATTGTNGFPATKAFTNPANAWDGPNRQSASTLVEGGGLRFIDGSGFTMRTQAGNITKVEALYLGYFSAALTDDTLGLKITQGAVNNTTTMNTALIDSYVGEPAALDPNSAISWDVTALRPGGGTWSWADNFSTLRLEVNPSKASSADQKIFYLDAIGVRITTDQPCEAVNSTTLSPVPLQDSYDTTSVAFVSASPAPTSVNTATGVIQWSDVGPIPAGSTRTVTVTMRALNISGTRTGSCGASSPPAANSVCNWAETAFGANRVYYSDGRPAVDASSRIAASLAGKGELRGTVWNDTNNDGWANDDGEAGVPNATVTLFACVRSSGALETDIVGKTCIAATGGNAWRVITTTTTNSSGAYEFIGLDTGYYLIEVGDTNAIPATGSTAPFGGTQTAEPNDSQAATGGLATGTTGVCAGVGGCNNTWGNPAADLNTLNLINNPAAEEIIGGINFGYNIPNAVLYGNIWWDVDGDATTDPGDSGLSGFTVQRYSDPNGDGNIADGTLQATTTSDSSGNYSFGGLAAGSYVIVVTPPTLQNKVWVETHETTGGTSSLNNQIPVTVAAGAISGSHNFGYTQRDASTIGDTLYYDFDGDGIQDPTEGGIPNITVWLYEDVDRDGTIDAGIDEIYATTATNSSGLYLFTSIPAGSYVVKVDTTDADFPTDVVATADPDLSAASIGDLIWLDSNGTGTREVGEDGIPGVIVNLYNDADNSGTLNGGDSLITSTITDVNGSYLFTALSAGRYFVDVDETSLPSSALALTTTDPASTLITLTGSTSATQVLTADAGYSPSVNFSIGNRLWHDVDNDGVQDAGEPGIPYVDIVVTNGTGTGCATACRVTTDAAGYWILTGLTNGTFTVNVDEADADFPRNFTVATGTTDPRVVTVSTADLTNVDFGYRYTGTGASPTGSISGRIWLDGDGDLAYDVGEARSGSTLNLLDANGETVATSTSAADGTYTFNGIFIGTYTVQAVDRLGTRFSTIFLSAAQTVSGVNVVYRSTLETTPDSQSGASVDGVRANLLQDFGYQRFTGSIGDTIYWDVNENASQDLGEPGFANVTVRLYDAVWTDTNNNGLFESGEGTRTLITTTSTASDNPATTANEGGTYLFTNLSPLATGHHFLVEVVTTTLPGTSQTLIADPDTDGYPCTLLPNPDVATDELPPLTVCDSQQLVRGFASGNNYLGADFGYRVTGTGNATIGDTLWLDNDGDGTRDSGEPGIGAITVWLDSDDDGVVDWTDTNANGVWDSGEGERWTQTDVEGYYVFTGLSDATYNVKVRTSDPDWPSGLPTTPTFEVRSGNTVGRNNAVQAVVTSGAVSSIFDGDPATTDACSSCNLSIDFGYRYAGTKALSGTVCTDDASKNGYCGDTAITYSGAGTGESVLQGIQVAAYRWTDDGDTIAWSGATLDPGDTFVLVGTTSTNANGDYSFTNLPDDVVIVFSVAESQNLRLTTTNGNSSVEDANVLKRQFYEGTALHEGNTVTVIGRQALSLAGDVDGNVQDVDFAFDPTLNSSILYDFGDLPASYANTLLANSGARHRVTPSSLYLGAGVTTENDGTHSATATADGADNGVVMVSDEFNPGGGAYINVTASAAGWLSAWMDFNADGDFTDPYEFILDQEIPAGTTELSFLVPSYVENSGVTDFFSRFRIYPSRPGVVASTGPAVSSSFQQIGGEVEDHVFPMPIGPNMVEMFSTEGVQGKRGVTLTWQTTREVDNLGFHVYRQVAGGTPEKINPHIITGSALVTGRKTTGPRNYRFVDRKPVDGFVQYWIEDVDINGTKTMHGPITPRTATSESEEPPVTTEPDPTLGSLGGIFTTQPGMGVAIPAPPAPGAAQRDEQWQLASVPAVKVVVTKPGWYRVKKSDLVAAGFDPGDNARVLSVFTDGTEVPVLVNAKNEGKFDADDSIEFFGRGIDMPGTGSRVYYVTARRGNGLRVKSTGGRGNSGSPAPANFPYTFERVEKVIFFTSMVTNGDRENFYGPVITSWPVDQVLTVANRDSGTARLEIAVQGVTANLEHVVQVKLNGSVIGNLRINGRTRKVTTLTVSASQLLEGSNTVNLTALNGWEDVSVLESIKLVYPHRFRADNDALTFTATAGTKVVVGGFTTDKVRVVDVTDPMVPQLIDAEVGSEAGGTKSVSFATSGTGTRTFFAFAEPRVMAPAQIAWNEPSTWNATTNGANLVIITNRAFMASAKALETARDAQGIATVVVDVQNVYDEFSYGHHAPEAIRAFLQQTQKWSTKPRYVILLGDASFDPRNYIGFGSYDFVPTKLVPTDYVKTASDDWFADFNGTGMPSLAIGRIPARTAAQAKAVVDKLIARGASAPSGDWAQYVQIVSDAPVGYPFDRAAGQLAAQVPSSFTVDRISIATTPSPSTAIVNAFNRGSVLTTYLGHGSTELWSNGQFSSAAAASLNNGNRLPFVVVMNCLNGYFHDLFSESIAEALMNNANGGAIGVWASSALTGAGGQLDMSLAFNRGVFGATPMTVGDAVLLAKQATANSDIRRTWILFGDPTIKLK